jgi:hypothetical protein
MAFHRSTVIFFFALLVVLQGVIATPVPTNETGIATPDPDVRDSGIEDFSYDFEEPYDDDDKKAGAEKRDLEARGGWKSGDGTWYAPGLGACEWVNSKNQNIVAISTHIWANKKHCGKMITIKDPKSKKTITAKVVDRCMGCSSGDVDMSPKVFKHLRNLGVGRFRVQWHFN